VELETVPNRVAVPGIGIHPTGASTYEPFLDGAPPAAPPDMGIHGGIDIRDAHTAQLRLRLYLPEASSRRNKTPLTFPPSPSSYECAPLLFYVLRATSVHQQREP